MATAERPARRLPIRLATAILLPMTPVMIRDTSPADLPAITAIYGHAVRDGCASFEVAPPARSDMARRREALAAAAYPYLVAEDQGVVVGYAYAALMTRALGAGSSQPPFAGTRSR